MKFYYDKKSLLNNELYCLGIDLDEDEINNFVVYEGVLPFSGVPMIEGNILRPATFEELVNLKELVLKEGQKIVNNKIINIPAPDYYFKWNGLTWEVDETLLKDGDYLENGKLKTIVPDQEFIKKNWDKVNHIWNEGATKEEKLEYLKNKILDKTQELIVYEKSGFCNDNLKNKIEELIKEHSIVSEEIARIENKKY